MENLDDLLYLGWKNGQIHNNTFSFMIRMAQAEGRFYQRLFGSSEEKNDKQKNDGIKQSVPEVFMEHINNRLARNKELKELGLL